MAGSYVRPDARLVPDPTPESLAFWTGGRDGQLLVYRCRGCGHWFHPPAPACFRCRSLEVGPEPVSGRGKVAAYTVHRQPWLPGFPPPYVVAMIELAEEPGVRIVSNIVDVSPEDLRVGLDVGVFFEEWAAGESGAVWIPLFRPAGMGSQ
jgi:uncharacterized protein